MLRADLYFEDNLFHICVEIIKREEGIIMYWCCVYGKRVESYYCIRVDDNPLIITSSTNTTRILKNMFWIVSMKLNV